MLDRTFVRDEDQHGRNRVAVLDHGYWLRRFGGDRKIVGKTLTLDNERWIIVGVMPPGFQPVGGEPAPIYTPYVVADNPHGLRVIGRLGPGVSLAAAQAELDGLATQLERENPDWKGIRLRGVPMLEQVTGQQRPLLSLLLGAVALVLLIACVNVASLLLARASARRREMEIRVALGASRARIAGFVLAEATLIAGAASLAAVAIAHGSLRLLSPLTATLPRADELEVDGVVLLWTLLAGALTALVFGAIPAVRPVKMPLGAIVAVEMALAVVLLAGAGLLMRTFAAIRSADLGYDAGHVLTNFLALAPVPEGTGRAPGAALYARVRERVAALPGVRAVATASSLPMFGVSITLDVQPEGQPARRRREHQASVSVISEDYFKVMAIRWRSGRMFTQLDRDGAQPVAIVSESVSRRYFDGRATGRRIILPEFKFNIDGGKDVAPEIVGVAGNVCVHSVEDCEAEHIYLPESQAALRMEHLLVRTTGDPMSLAKAVRHAVYLEAPTVPLDDAQTLEQRAAYLTDGPRRGMWLLGVFAGLALLLAAAGIYGVAAYLSGQRRHEIGIRMALGAGFSDIAWLVYLRVLVPSAAGLAAGTGAAVWLTQLLRAAVAEAKRPDRRTLALAGLTLLCVAVLAATGPALGAALSNPARVLRRE